MLESDFQKLLLKLAMNLSDAYRILEVPENTKDENLIKKNFKKLTLKYHPDLDGSHEKMVELNQAKDRIDLALKGKGNSSFDYRDTPSSGYSTQQKNDDARKRWEQKQREQDESDKQTRQELETYLNEFKKIMTSKKDEYLNYFQNIVGSQPRFFIKEKINVGYNTGNFFVDCKFKFEDGSECSLNVSFSKTDYNYFYNSDVYYNNKLYKMQKSRLSSSKTQEFFTNPENVFPKDKLSKIFKKIDTKPTSFKRKDAEAMLVKDVFAKNVDAATWKIQISDTHFVYVNRIVFMKLATWSVIGLYEKYRRIAILPSKYPRTYVETIDKTKENNFLAFIDFLKEAKKNNIDWKILDDL